MSFLCRNGHWVRHNWQAGLDCSQCRRNEVRRLERASIRERKRLLKIWKTAERTEWFSGAVPQELGVYELRPNEERTFLYPFHYWDGKMFDYPEFDPTACAIAKETMGRSRLGGDYLNALYPMFQWRGLKEKLR